jgi:hypothetical protein
MSPYYSKRLLFSSVVLSYGTEEKRDHSGPRFAPFSVIVLGYEASAMSTFKSAG